MHTSVCALARHRDRDGAAAACTAHLPRRGNIMPVMIPRHVCIRTRCTATSMGARRLGGSRPPQWMCPVLVSSVPNAAYYACAADYAKFLAGSVCAQPRRHTGSAHSRVNSRRATRPLAGRALAAHLYQLRPSLQCALIGSTPEPPKSCACAPPAAAHFNGLFAGPARRVTLR